jgi:outer membrane lipoprotein-sorting protein
MMKIPVLIRPLILLLLALPLTGCLFRSHRVEPAPASSVALQTGTVSDLVNRVNVVAHDIKTLNATVDIASSVGGSKSGKVTEYQEIRGYILVRQPGMLRMIGLAPVVRTRAFDMVSSGPGFKLYIPAKSRLYIGRNDLGSNGATGLTGMRPQIIYNALLLNDIDPQDDIAVMEVGREVVTDAKSHKKVEQPDYRLDVIHRGPAGWFLERKIYFSRTDLQPRRQRVFDSKGEVVSDIQYDKWKQYDTIWFPSVIEIWRPIEEYRITIGVVKLVMNEALTDQQFELTTPENTQVVEVGNGNLNGTPSSTALNH